jgi:hypothetical protein
MAPRLIVAKFPGYCRNCGESFEEGALIGFNLESEVICEDCRYELAERNISSLVETVCPKCHMTTCDCGKD